MNFRMENQRTLTKLECYLIGVPYGTEICKESNEKYKFFNIGEKRFLNIQDEDIKIKLLEELWSVKG